MAVKVRALDITPAHVGRLVRPETLGNISTQVYEVRAVSHEYGRAHMTLRSLGYVFEDITDPANWGEDFTDHREGACPVWLLDPRAA